MFKDLSKFYQWICLLHIILDFWNRITATQLLELPHQFGSCDHQYTPSQDWKHESYLVPSQGCTMDSRHSHQKWCYLMAAISQAVWGSYTVMQKNMQMVHDIVMIYFNKLSVNFSCRCAFTQRYHITLRTSGWDYTSRLFAILNYSNCAPVMHTWLPNTCLLEKTLSSDVTMQKWHNCLDPLKYLLCIFTSWLTYVSIMYGSGPLCSVP